MSSPFRRRVELQAGPLVVLMAKLPRVVPFLVVLALLVAGLLIQGLGRAPCSSGCWRCCWGCCCSWPGPRSRTQGRLIRGSWSPSSPPARSRLLL